MATDIRMRIADTLDDAILNPPVGVSKSDPYATGWGYYLADVILAMPGIAIVKIPTVAYKGPHDTDASDGGQQGRVGEVSGRWRQCRLGGSTVASRCSQRGGGGVMALYIVRCEGKVSEYYEVEADNAIDAADRWPYGRIVNSEYSDIYPVSVNTAEDGGL